MTETPLEAQLRANGCIMSPGDFLDLLGEILVQLFPLWTIEELMRNLKESKHFCDVVRWHSSCFTLPNELILTCLRGVNEVA
jgi:hypothetical protein